MHWKVKREFLSRVEVFENLSLRDLKAVAKSCSESSYNEGEYLCRQGERGVAAFLIVSGTVRIENELDDGNSVLLANLGQGAMVGELSIIDGAERVASIQAAEEVTALVLAQWSMLGLLKDRPSIAAAMLPIIVRRFRQTTAELRRRESDSSITRKSIFQ